MEALAIATTRDGASLKLHCRPGRPRTAIQGVHGGALKLDVAAPPEKGKANDEIVAFLAKLLGVRRAAVVISAGQGGRDKAIVIAGCDAATLEARLRPHLAP